MMGSGQKLSEGSLEIIMNGGSVSEPIMQVLGSKKIISSVRDRERYRLLLSDGKFKVNIAMYTVQTKNIMPQSGLEMYSVIKLKRYFSNVIKSKNNRDTRVLLILDLDLIAEGEKVGYVIGDPISLTDLDVSISQSSDRSVTKKRENSTSSSAQTKHISPISSLNPFHNNWVIVARVVNKTNIRNWSNAKGEGKLFSVDLVDQDGEIRATAFRELVDKFFDMLEVDKVYYISKCQIQPINRRFCSLKHNFEMSFTTETVVEECLNGNDFIPQITYNFTSIDKVAVMEPGTVVDVIGVCKAVSDLQTIVSKTSNKEMKKKQVLLVDQSQTAISVTLWGSSAETFFVTGNPIILLKNAKIYEFCGAKSITLVMGTQLKINPDIPETDKLRQWFEREGTQIEAKNVSIGLGSNGPVPWKTFKEVQQQGLGNTDKGFYYQTFGTILVVRFDRVVYKACPTADCQKKVVDMENGMYRCEKCNREFDSFKYRLLVSMNVSDATSSQWVTMFSSEAEKILGKTAQEIGEAMENDPDKVAEIFEEVNFKQFVFKCRAKLDTYNDEQKVKTVVVGVNLLNYEEYNAYLVEKIEKLGGIFK